MRLSRKIGLGIVALLSVTCGVFYFTGLAARYLPIGVDAAVWPGKAHVELMPETSPEWSEKHIPGPDGKDIETDVLYRNGDRGVRYYRNSDHSLREFHIDFACGGTRFEAVYAADGQQIVSGFELRADQTLKWKAAVNDGLVTTTTYWYNGATVFSVEKRKVGSQQADTMYYRPNGKPWVHQILTSAGTPSSATFEKVWDKDGNPLYQWQTAGSDGSTTTSQTAVYYRAGSSTPLFKQTYGQYTSTYYGGEGEGEGGSSTSTILKQVDEYGADGTTVVREIDMTEDGTNVAQVIVFHADGSKTIYTVTTDLSVTQVAQYDKTGSVVKTTEPKPGAEKVTVDSKLTGAMPSPQNPVDTWNKQESNPSARQDVP